jgi:hypothetical protein
MLEQQVKSVLHDNMKCSVKVCYLRKKSRCEELKAYSGEFSLSRYYALYIMAFNLNTIKTITKML